LLGDSFSQVSLLGRKSLGSNANVLQPEIPPKTAAAMVMSTTRDRAMRRGTPIAQSPSRRTLLLA